MDLITNKSTNDLTSNGNKDNILRNIKTHTSLDLINKKQKKNKNYRKYIKSLDNFIKTKTKITFESFFDHKGAKKFLAEKEKAMEELILEDEIIEIIEEKKFNKKISNSCNKKNNSKSKKNLNKVLKYYPSQNALINLNLKNNKKIYEKNKKAVSSSKSININFRKNLKNIGKIYPKNKKKRISIESIKSQVTNLKSNEPSYLFTGENDSFIKSIINQMKTIKN